MKKLLFISILFVIFILFTGCDKNLDNISFKNTINFQTLNEINYPDKQYKKYYDQDPNIKNNQFEYLNNFLNITTKEIFKNEENYIYSPISLYMALSMLAQGADGKTKEEILSLLQNTDLNNVHYNNKLIYDHNHYKNKKGYSRIANSIWIRNDFNVKDEYLNILSNYYYSNAYNTNFGDEATQNIVDWINHYTNDLLDINKETYQIDNNTAMLLINTIYFDNKWKEQFKKGNNYKDIFYGNIEREVEYMNHKIESIYYETEDFEIFYDYFENENKIKYIFPKQHINVIDCLQKDVLNYDLNTIKPQNATIKLSVPKFKTYNSYELNDVLINLGLKTMFSNDASFSNLSDKKTTVSYVLQDAGIIFSEDGVKAAAATVITNSDTVSELTLFLDIKLNRPFIYVITDAHNVCLFVGVVFNPEY